MFNLKLEELSRKKQLKLALLVTAFLIFPLGSKCGFKRLSSWFYHVF